MALEIVGVVAEPKLVVLMAPVITLKKALAV